MRSREIPKIIARQIEGNFLSAEHALEAMQMISRLEGIPLTRRQHFGAAAIGAAADSYDAVFDSAPINEARKKGEAILDAQSGVKSELDSVDPTTKAGLQLASDNLNSKALVTLRELTEAQIYSLKQRDLGIGKDEVNTITYQKGSRAALLLALEVNPEMSEERQACFKELGFLLQLFDDFQDATIDRESGLVTLATISSHDVNILEVIRNQEVKVKKLFIESYGDKKCTEIFQYIRNLSKRAGLVS